MTDRTEESNRTEDERYIQCRECGARNRMFVWVQLPVVPGDGVPWFDGNASPTDIADWECDECASAFPSRGEACFVGYPGITEAEIQEAYDA